MAELKSPIGTVTPSRSRACAGPLVAPVAGLTESSDVMSNWRPMTPPARMLISSPAIPDAGTLPGAELAEKPNIKALDAILIYVGLAR